MRNSNEIETAKSFLAKASTPSERQQAIETILSATSDISKLTPEQTDTRLSALKESIEAQKREFELFNKPE